MPNQLIGFTRPFIANGGSNGGVGTHIRTALLFRHAHADGQRLFLGMGHIARVIGVIENLGQPLLRQCRRQADGGHRGKRHGQRATVTGVDLRL